MKKRGRKTNIELINESVWNKKIIPKEFVLSISNEKFVFNEDFVNVNAADQMVNTISKSEWPKSILLSHKSAKVLTECVDWLIKYCETFMRLMPDVKVDNALIYDRVEAYKKSQVKYNKKRRKKKYK
ncbi:hypothetical protein CMI37_34470 [Candidatus Pacearchaeota archaeon]|nr:hypothetical protein [Candidatus Pacearchaeota archaeon]|tara:strand:+ start:4121 stop:4501 length:381 start_codon:yes stop_codon:yes gene_type:complete